MARPREFDEEEVIERAMNAFWQHGYDGASLPVLLEAMRLSRGSFYKAFGSKKALFLKVLERYDAQVIRPGVAMLKDGSRPGSERLSALLQGALSTMEQGDRRGCLACNTAAGAAHDDPDISAVVNDQLRRLAKGMAAALADTPRLRGRSRDELRAEGEALAQHYMGLRVAGRSGRDMARLRSASTSHLVAMTGVATDG